MFYLELAGQNIDFENIPDVKKFKVNGGLSSNLIYYNSNYNTSRDPFTYNFQGNLNLNWINFTMPLTFNYSNQGSNFDYQIPFKFNRLSLHPSYKWIKAHIGDVSMTLSPYTLNGYQFTGAGVELNPKSNWKLAALGGRFLKAVNISENENDIVSYKRMGYGAQLGYDAKKWKVGVIGFYAKDNVNSVTTPLDEKGVFPQENLVLSFLGEATIKDNVKLSLEYANSSLTEDQRSQCAVEKKELIGSLMKGNSSTKNYHALKTALNFEVADMKLGVGYERIDPDYTTLGAFYFNNDFENITLEGSRSFLKNKINLSFNVGLQRDDLNNQKSQSTQRLVAAINTTIQARKNITITGSYSNFTTYTNQKLNQFDELNDNNLTDDEIQALQYRQLSQNSNANLNWIIKNTKKKTHNLNLNYNLAASANEENGIIHVGQANNFHNANANYSIQFKPQKLTLSTLVLYTYNDIGVNDAATMGAGLNATKKVWKDRINLNLGGTYNSSNNKNIKTDIINLKFGASTTIAEKHNLNLNAIQLFKQNSSDPMLRELTVTFGYNYSFDVKKPRIKFKKREKKEKEIDISGAVYDALKLLQTQGNQMTDRLNESYFKNKYGEDIGDVIFQKGYFDFQAEKNKLEKSGINFTKEEKVFIAHHYLMNVINTINSKKEMLQNDDIVRFIKQKLAENPDYGDEPIETIEIDIAKYFFGQVFNE